MQIDTPATSIRARAQSRLALAPPHQKGGKRKDCLRGKKAAKKRHETQATRIAHHPEVSFEPLSNRKTADVFFNPSGLPRVSFPLHKQVARRALGLCHSEIGKYGTSQKQWHVGGK